MTRLIVTRPHPSSGLGANLYSMAAALRLCERTERSLVVDWTGMDCLRDKELNYFVEFFEPLREWRGVDIRYTASRHDPDLGGSYDRDRAQVIPEDDYPEFARKPPEADTCVLMDAHGRLFDFFPDMDERATKRYIRDFYRELRLRGPLAERLALLRKRHFEGRVVVGLHVRHGNGEFGSGRAHGMRRLEDDESPAIIDQVFRLASELLGRLGANARSNAGLFVATDSEAMNTRLLRLPGAFGVRRGFPPPGVGHQFADYAGGGDDAYSDVQAVEDAIVDMFLLAECEGLVHSSGRFSQYGLYLTYNYAGNVRGIGPAARWGSRSSFRDAFMRAMRALRKRVAKR